MDGDARMTTLGEGIRAAICYTRPLLVYPLFCCIVYYLSGYYMQPRRRHVSSELLTTFLSTAVITLVAFFYIILDDEVPDYYAYYNSIAVLFCLQFGLTYALRVATSLGIHAYRPHPRTYTIRLDEAEQKDTQGEECQNTQGEHPLKEKPEEALLLPRGTERVIIETTEATSEQELFRIIAQIYPKRVEIAFTARTYDLLIGRTSITDFEEQPLISITESPMTDCQLTLKRTFDILASALGLVLLSPLLVGISIAVKCSSPGPILYQQERIGHYGRPFKILKFRTMCDHAEGEQPQLTQDNDPRVTRLGHWLRRYRLDELPQLWNILRGDMAIVGPRPERAFFIQQIAERAPYYCLIYKMRPGLTSWGPIKVGYTDTLDKMIQRLGYDIAYMENMSLRLDLKILFYTIGVIIHGKGK